MQSFEVTEKYKGKWVRLYKEDHQVIEGVLLGYWHHYYVTLQSDAGKSAQVTFVDSSDVRLVLPLHLLGTNGKIAKALYSSVN